MKGFFIMKHSDFERNYSHASKKSAFLAGGYAASILILISSLFKTMSFRAKICIIASVFIAFETGISSFLLVPVGVFIYQYRKNHQMASVRSLFSEIQKDVNPFSVSDDDDNKSDF